MFYVKLFIQNAWSKVSYLKTLDFIILTDQFLNQNKYLCKEYFCSFLNVERLKIKYTTKYKRI